MGSLLIRNVPATTMAALKARAKRHRRSVQAEVLDVLQTTEIPAGDALLAWLRAAREPRLHSRRGIAEIRRARDER